MCSCKQNGMLQAQLDPGAWLIHVQLLSPLALFSLSVSYFPHGDKSGPSGSHQLSKGSRAPDEVPGLLTWWEGVTCPSPSQSQARSSNTGWLGDHISRSESRAFQGKLAHVPRRRKGPPWGFISLPQSTTPPILSSTSLQKPSVWDRHLPINPSQAHTAFNNFKELLCPSLPPSMKKACSHLRVFAPTVPSAWNPSSPFLVSQRWHFLREAIPHSWSN